MKPAPSFSRATVQRIEHTIQFTFQDKAWMPKIFVHGSMGGKDFQRLEFLGDRVLGLAMADILWHMFPQDQEGALSQRLFSLVRQESLTDIAQACDLSSFLHYAAEKQSHAMKHVWSDCCEALIGAIYLDQGWDAAKSWIALQWGPLLRQQKKAPPLEEKSHLQQIFQKRFQCLPTYVLEKKEGKDHAPVFFVQVGTQKYFAKGVGDSRQDAEKHAARTWIRQWHTET